MTSHIRRSRKRTAYLTGTSGLVLAAVLAAGTSAGASTPARVAPTKTTTNVPAIPNPPKSLVKAAEREGHLVWYTGLTSQPINNQIIAAFNKKYPGITVSYTASATATLEAKYLSEAQAGSQQGDVITCSYSSFFATAVNSGYLIPMTKIIPGFTHHYPLNYIEAHGTTGIILFLINGFAYNTSTVPAAEAPKSFADFAKPFWKGHVITVDPNDSVAYLEFWDMMIHKYGKTVVSEIGANIAPDQGNYNTFTAPIQAMLAGEGYASLLSTTSITAPFIAQGAPVKFVVPKVVTGSEYAIGVSSHGPDTAAGKLFAYWLLSKSGQTAFANANSTGSPLDPKAVPAGWYPPNFGAGTEKSQIDSLLGIGPN